MYEQMKKTQTQNGKLIWKVGVAKLLGNNCLVNDLFVICYIKFYVPMNFKISIKFRKTVFRFIILLIKLKLVFP